MLPIAAEEFRVAQDPALSFTPSGVAMCRLLLVTNSRKKVNDEWVDDKVLWVRATAWRQMAENCAESLTKGDLVVVTGRLNTDEWEQDGQKRSALAMNIDNIGPSLRWNAHRKIEAERTDSTATSPPASSGASGDPWATSGSEGAPPF